MKRLGHYLLDIGATQKAQIEAALERQRGNGLPLGQLLLEQGQITATALELALALQRRDRSGGLGMRSAAAFVLDLARRGGLSARLPLVCAGLGLLSGALSFPIVFYFYSGWAWNMIGLSADVPQLAKISLATVALVLIGVAFEAFVAYLCLWVSSFLLRSLAAELHQRLIHRAVQRVDEETRAAMMGIYTQSLEQYAVNIEAFLVKLPKAVSGLLIFFTIIFLNYPGVAAMTLGLAVLSLVVPPWVAKWAEPFVRREPELMGAAMNRIEPFFLHFRTVGGVLLDRATALVRRFLREHHLNQASKWFYWNSSFNVKTLLDLGTLSAILIYGGYLVLEGRMEVAALFSLFLAVTLIMPRFDDLYQSYFHLYWAGNHASIIHEQLKLPAMTRDASAFDVDALLPMERLTVEVGRFGFGARPVLEHLSCRFLPGRLYLLVGESGSGKSTLAQLIAGLLRADTVRVAIEYRGGSVLTETLGHVAYVGQEHVFFENLPVENNVACASELDAAGRARVAAEIERFRVDAGGRLGDPQVSVNTQFSGGEKQRLHLLQGLLAPQKIKIFDEPTASLDGETADVIKRRLIDVAPDEIRLVITHDPDWPVEADRIVRLYPIAD